MLYRKAKDVALWVEKRKRGNVAETFGLPDRAGRRQPRAAVVVGYGPAAQLLPHFAGQQHAAQGCGNEYRHLVRLLRAEGARGARRLCVAALREAGLEKAEALLLTSPSIPAGEVPPDSARWFRMRVFWRTQPGERSPLPARQGDAGPAANAKLRWPWRNICCARRVRRRHVQTELERVRQNLD